MVRDVPAGSIGVDGADAAVVLKPSSDFLLIPYKYLYHARIIIFNKDPPLDLLKIKP